MWFSGLMPKILMLPAISYLSRYNIKIWTVDS